MTAFFYHPALIIADQWKDYELLQTGDGMKKERWGEYVLVRPDPQIIWPLAKGGWGKADAIYHRSASGGGHWEFQRKLPEEWEIRFRQLRFRIRPTNFKHTGLFPEQAANWVWFSQLIADAVDGGRDVSVLNLFGYTGAATVAAAAAGARVCHVDAAKGMVAWCKTNASLSGLENHPVRYLVDDCKKFTQRELRRGNTYDGIIMDPPVFGRGGKNDIWKLEDHLHSLVMDAASLLSANPLFLLINAYTAGISPVVLGNLLTEVAASRGGSVSVGEIALPITQERRYLPCGVFGRWTP